MKNRCVYLTWKSTWTRGRKRKSARNDARTAPRRAVGRARGPLPRCSRARGASGPSSRPQPGWEAGVTVGRAAPHAVCWDKRGRVPGQWRHGSRATLVPGRRLEAPRGWRVLRQPALAPAGEEAGYGPGKLPRQPRAEPRAEPQCPASQVGKAGGRVLPVAPGWAGLRPRSPSSGSTEAVFGLTHVPVYSSSEEDGPSRADPAPLHEAPRR